MPIGPALLGGGDDMAMAAPMPGVGQSPMTGMALSALRRGPGAGASAGMQKVEEALDLAHKLVMAILPQLAQWNPKLARDAHAAARTLLGIRADVRKEQAPQPPPDLMLGMGIGGAPGPLGPSPQGAPAMGGAGMGGY